MDQAAPSDRFFRKLFGGKVAPVPEQPESIFISADDATRGRTALVSRRASAVFLDTWMSGGLGRAQSGYDEMVFRSMVKDGTRFYDPLGLVSEGTKIDFQLQINSYLYGTRFITWLARRYSPEKVIEWVVAEATAAGPTTPRSSATSSAQSIEPAWAAWEKDEREFQQQNLAKLSRGPDDAVPATHETGAGLGVARLLRCEATGRFTPRSIIRASSPTSEPSAGPIGGSRRLADIKGPTSTR